MRNKQLPATSVFSFDSAKSVLITSIMMSPYVVGQPAADQCGPQIVDDLILHAKKGKECATDLNGNDIQAQKACIFRKIKSPKPTVRQTNGLILQFLPESLTVY